MVALFSAASAGAQAPDPTKPAGVPTDVTEVTAIVESVDAARHIVKVKGPEGHIRTIKVGSDLKNFAAVKKGNQLVVRHTEEVVIAVTK
jgi:hypothetical protein